MYIRIYSHVQRIAATGKPLASVSEATPKDVDIAVDAAERAFETVWGLNVTGTQRSAILWKFAQLLEENVDELTALESLSNGMSHCLSPQGKAQTSTLDDRQSVRVGKGSRPPVVN